MARRAEAGASVRFHSKQQDTSAPGWLRLLDLVEEAAADGREEFFPLSDLAPGEYKQIVTLPATIAKLTAVRHLGLYGSRLVRLPPEIGAMASLEKFTPYTSHRLHWFPFELTRCTKLVDSTVSTRAIYGNNKYRPPFPALESGPRAFGADDNADLDPGIWGAERIERCSVCDRAVGAGVHQVWISLLVATDVLPLLVNACSADCVAALPATRANYVSGAHSGGPDLGQPEPTPYSL